MAKGKTKNEKHMMPKGKMMSDKEMGHKPMMSYKKKHIKCGFGAFLKKSKKK